MEEILLCACGCGNPIVPKRNHRWQPARYIPGHHTRGHARHVYTPRPEEIPSGICECGCGGRTSISNETCQAKRRFRGHPHPFIRGHSVQRYGPDSPFWKGGRRINAQGYVVLYTPDHPRADKDGYVQEHRLVLEKKLGRFLEPDEISHHINGVKDDNREDNLLLMSWGEHSALHHKGPRTAEAIAHMREGQARRRLTETPEEISRKASEGLKRWYAAQPPLTDAERAARSEHTRQAALKRWHPELFA